MPKQFAIQFNQVSKSFNQNPSRRLRDSFKIKYDHIFEKVIDDVSFSILKNQTVGLYGANGSGKTTFLKLMAGIIKPDSGTIITRGKVAAVLELGAGLNPELSGWDNIEIYSAILGTLPRDRYKIAQKIIDFSGLAEKIYLPLFKYSSGMKARLAFSIVAFSQADIWLLDEVFAVGDTEFLDKSRQLITSLKKKKTIVLSSHNIDLLNQFCDSTFQINERKIVERSQLTQFFIDLPNGFEFEGVIGSNSMAPTLKRGAKVLIKRVPFDKLKLGDIVALGLKNAGVLIAHRIVSKSKRGSEVVFETRGDNSYAEDSWLLTEKNYVGRVEREKKYSELN